VNTLWALPIGAAALLCLIALAQSLANFRKSTRQSANAGALLNGDLRISLHIEPLDEQPKAAHVERGETAPI
ncbi:MAG: hypothetical protein WBE71_16635, partial [Xanthobacteraceae bacterium]